MKPDSSLSVDLARLTTPEDTLHRVTVSGVWGVAELKAAKPRELGFSVKHNPSVGNYAHTLIEGDNNMDKCDLLAEASRIVVAPERVTV